MKLETMTFEETLTGLYQQHAVLLADASVWPANVSRPLKRAIRTHRSELLEMLASADYRVCCAPGYHYRSWSHNGTCELCKQLTPSIRVLDVQLAKRRGHAIQATRQDEREMALTG